MRLGLAIGVSTAALFAGAWFMQPQYAGMAYALDFNNDRYALPDVGPELLVNSTFDSDTNAWVVQSTATKAWVDGTLELTVAASADRIEQSLGTTKLIPGRLYTVDYRIRCGTATSIRLQIIRGAAGSYVAIPAHPSNSVTITGTGWTQGQFHFTAPASDAFVQLSYNGSAGTAYADYISVREVRLFDYGPELIVGGAFDGGASGFTGAHTGAATLTVSGGRGVLTVPDGAVDVARIRYAVPTEIGGLYEIAVTHTSEGTAAGGMNVFAGPTGGSSSTFATGTSKGATRVVQFTATSNPTWLSITTSSTGTTFLDDVTVKKITPARLRPASRSEVFSQYTAASTAARTYIDASGTLKADLLANEPRFTWEGGKRQLLLENQGTNQMSGSDAFDTLWNPNQGTYTRQVVTEAGRRTVNLTRQMGLAPSYLTRGMPGLVAAATAFTWQMWVPKRSGEMLAARVQAAYPSRIDVQINQETGALNASTGGDCVLTSATATLVGNVWRIEVRGATGASNLSTMMFAATNDLAKQVDTNAVAAGYSASICATQIEAQAFGSSYIPTAGAAVTRAIETFRLSPLIEAIVQRTEGTAVVRGQSIMRGGGSILGVDTAGGLLSVNIALNQIGVRLADNNFMAGTSVSAVVSGSWGAAVAFDSAGANVAFNGVAAGGGTGATPTRASAFLGRNGSGSYADGRYDFLGGYAYRVANSNLPSIAVAA